MWKGFVGLILVIVILKVLLSCSVFETQSTPVNRPDLSVVAPDKLPLLPQNGVHYTPKYKTPEMPVKHAEVPDEFEVTEEELMLAPEATD